MVENHKDVQDPEADRWDREEVDRPGHIQVISQEWQPRCGSLTWLLWLDHVFADRLLAWRVVLQQEKRIPDPFRAP